MALSVLFLVGIAVAVCVGVNIGGSSTGVAFGPAAGSGVLSMRQASGLMAVFVLLGGFTVGTNVVDTLGPRRSIAVLIPSFAIAQAAIFYGLPTSFDEIFVSAIVGSGYAAGRSSVSWSKMGYTVLALVASLVLALALSDGAYVTAVTLL